MFDIKPFEYPPEATVDKKLNVLLDYLLGLMHEVIKEREPSYKLHTADNDYEQYWSQIIDIRILDSLRTAWPDIERRIDKIRPILRELTAESIDRHGLSGPELNLKLDALEWASRELSAATRITSRPIGPRKSKRIVQIMKKNFELGEIVIGSILEATKAGTALKEILKLFGHIFKDFNKK